MPTDEVIDAFEELISWDKNHPTEKISFLNMLHLILKKLTLDPLSELDVKGEKHQGKISCIKTYSIS